MEDVMAEIIKLLSVGEHSAEFASETLISVLLTNIRRLEPQGSGSRFPTLMTNLEFGSLTPRLAELALRELATIEAELRQVPVKNVVWKLGNGLSVDPAAQPVNRQAANVFEYFVDASGQPLISRLLDGVHECLRSGQRMRLTSPNTGAQKALGFGIALALVFSGAAWMVLGRLWFPRLAISPIYNRAAAIPVWTFGMDLVLLGVGIMVPMIWPAIGDWFIRYPLALIGVAIVAVIGWLVICSSAGFLPD
jgi:Immunity protein 70